MGHILATSSKKAGTQFLPLYVLKCLDKPLTLKYIKPRKIFLSKMIILTKANNVHYKT